MYSSEALDIQGVKYLRKVELFCDYENAKLYKSDEYNECHSENVFSYDKINGQSIDGIPISVTRNRDGGLDVAFVPDTHVLAIGATRSGKTTGYVIPTLNILMSKKNKPSLVISDPKQELYSNYSSKFEKNGYNVILLDFTNYRYSDCWNPLTKYYRYYQKYLTVEDEVGVVATSGGMRNMFRGKIYEDESDLELDINEVKEEYFAEVEKGIMSVASSIIPTMNTKDPFWEDSARDLLCAILYAMLEDSATGEITEEKFSFDTVLRIFDSFSDLGTTYDRGYFTDRDIEKSKGLQLAQKCIIEQASNTRKCICSSFVAKMNKFRDTSVRKITCANTFEISELDDSDKPTVIFLSYKDEESLHYDVISMFLTNLYTELIATARKKRSKLDRPFYFMLDEFGNLPKFKDFDKVISACGGRNIWFLLILQSYAQLYNIYEKNIAEIIKDNLNTHIFFGTNNPQTKREFSEECGKKTIIAPTSALNGTGESVEKYEKDTVSLIPVSALNRIEPGECIITQMREDVLWSHIERSYMCAEFDGEVCRVEDRMPKIRFSDPKYNYRMKKEQKSPFYNVD